LIFLKCFVGRYVFFLWLGSLPLRLLPAFPMSRWPQLTYDRDDLNPRCSLYITSSLFLFLTRVASWCLLCWFKRFLEPAIFASCELVNFRGEDEEQSPGKRLWRDVIWQRFSSAYADSVATCSECGNYAAWLQYDASQPSFTLALMKRVVT
jgi:hypothetical protein